ncbi:MAG: UvrD-helicase domain-containing protein [Fuerstiella sp.]|nr:UvrD-helicase domain-containing protein [Fuerstiella sp.]MCP4853445.1 UvrD-helicase domain-containing protein [Fuerstiella sp.]
MHELIRASAGSGKTFQLSGHFLRQLFLGNPPETILATTFTRKAAGEILQRVLLRLAGAAQDEGECAQLAEFMKPAEVTQQKANDLLVDITAQLHRMRVCTLDSFFQQVARSLTLELGLPPGWNIIDEHADRELRQQAIDAVLAQQVPKDAQRLMQMLAKGRSKRSVRDLISDTVQQFHELYLLADSDAWQRIAVPQRLTRKEMEHAQREVSAETPYNDTRAVKAVREDMDRFAAGQWEAFVQKGIAGKVFQGETSYYRKELPGGLIEAYEQLLSHAKSELLDAVARQNKATFNLVERFDREYTRLRAEHGWLGFGDVTRVLAQANDAASGSRMNFRLDSALQHLLLDEFQDTSPDQWNVLRRLALAIAQKDGENSFFCVGDPKQAIYGWRGGVAEILDAVENTIPEINSTSLDQSRRSSKPVIDTVNAVFEHIHQHGNLRDYGKACSDWEERFPPHSTVHDTMPGFAALQTSPEFEGLAEVRRTPYYRWIATKIQELHEQSPGAEIGVLTRKNATVARLVHELKLLGVHASEEGGTAPTDSPAVLAVLSLLHLASHPGCEISRFHVANSPLAGLVKLTTWKDGQSASRTAAEIRERLMDDGYGPTLQWISDAILDFCNQRDILRLQQIVGVGWQFDQSPSLNSSDFVQLLENSRLSKSEAAPVRVMTVHQSKGLEFDIVVLPELDGNLFRTPNAAAGSPAPDIAPDQVCVWRNKAVRSLLPQSLQQAFRQTTSRDVSEALCLLYVALTRAAHALHMFIPPISSSKTPASFSGVLLASLTDDQCAPPEQTLYECGDATWYQHVPEVSDGGSAAGSGQGKRQSVPRVLLAPLQERHRGLRRNAPSRHDRSGISAPPTEASTMAGSVDPRARGTLFHAWFEEVDWLQDGPPKESRLRQIADDHVVETATVDDLLPVFYDMLKQPNTSGIFTQAALFELPAFEAFAKKAANGAAEMFVENERPFVLKRDGAIVQGTIDRLVILREAGKPVAADIVDYKTDRLTGELATWVANKTQHYSAQLQQYRQAVQTCFGIEPTAISARLALLEVDMVVSPT